MRHSRCVQATAIVTAGLALLSLPGCGASSSRAPLTAPCSTRVARTVRLRSPAVHAVPVDGSPTAAVTTANGRWVFASLTTAQGAAIEVLRRRQGRLRATRTVPLQAANAWGMRLTPNGRFLVVADGAATAVLRVSVLEAGRGDPQAGVLTDQGSGQFEVTVSADDRYVFVSDEVSGTVSVFDLAKALRDGFSAPGVAVRSIRLAPGALGLALSPDGRLLYATNYGGDGVDGRLWVIDTARAEQPAGPAAVLASADAGCSPVRVTVAPSGHEVWVTARRSDALLGFDAAALRDHRPALQAVVRVGPEPVGLTLVDDGRLALVANSNRGLTPGSTGVDRPQTVSVVDTRAALAHRPALIGDLPAGAFPRDLSVDPTSGIVLAANFNSRTIEQFAEPSAR